MVLTIAFIVLMASVPSSQAYDDGATSHTAALNISGADSQLTVEVEDEAAFAAVAAYAASHGMDVTFRGEAAGILSVDPGGDAFAAAEAISGIEGVVSVSSQSDARVMFTPDDPAISDQWALGKIDAYSAWDITRGADSVIVAILDTGIDWNHPDLAANMWSNADGYHGYNFISDNWYPMDDNINGYDDNGDWVANVFTYHGTHVAGVVGAVSDNGEGMAGLANIKLMAVKVMNESGEGTDATVSAGLHWATDNGADIVTMSLGVDGVSIALENAVEYAASHGVIMVAAAGNSGTSVVSYPAAFPDVIAVGATDSSDRRASFSNYGEGLDVVAPGVNIYSTQGNGNYQYLSGTSTAAPHVAGVAALMLSINPALTPEQLAADINSTATDISMTGYDLSTGWGIVNAFAAVEMVSDPTVTVTDYPEYATPNSTFSVTWLVSGGDPGTISETHLTWGWSATSLTEVSASFSGTTWASFTVDAQAPDGNGTVYMKAYAVVDGTEYESGLVSLPVHEATADNVFMQFLNDVEDFIFNQLGLLNFILIVVALMMIAIAIGAASSRRRRTHVKVVPPRPAAPASLHQYQTVQGVHPQVPPPPPPPPRFEAYVDIVANDVIPPTLRVVEGTKVVFINRAWSPPPGVAVRSGTIDAYGEHHDSLFQSGLLIAPGDYWSVTFHRPGEYSYYITGMWKSGKVVVEVYKPEQHGQQLQQRVA